MKDKPIIKLNGFETIKNYAEAREVSTQYVYKLIKTGKVDVFECEDLNGLKLVRDKDVV